MKDDTKHSPTPWGYCYSGSSTWHIGTADDPQDSAPYIVIYDSNDDRALANARHIVRCVNGHDELVRVLGNLMREIYHQRDMGEFTDYSDATLKTANELLNAEVDGE